MKTVLGPSWPKRSDIRLVFIKSDPPGNTGGATTARVSGTWLATVLSPMCLRVGSEEGSLLVLLFISDVGQPINIFNQVGFIDVEQRRSCALLQMWRAELKAMERLNELEGHLVAGVPSEDDAEQGGAIVDTGVGDAGVKVLE